MFTSTLHTTLFNCLNLLGEDLLIRRPNLMRACYPLQPELYIAIGVNADFVEPSWMHEAKGRRQVLLSI